MATKKTFDFKLGEGVKLVSSEETGTIIGQARYSESNPAYLIRYKAANGQLTEGWWSESTLQLAPSVDSRPV